MYIMMRLYIMMAVFHHFPSSMRLPKSAIVSAWHRVYVKLDIYIYMYMHIHVYIYIYTYIYIYIYTHLYVYIYMYIMITQHIIIIIIVSAWHHVCTLMFVSFVLFGELCVFLVFSV